jgi:hypothetical protein
LPNSKTRKCIYKIDEAVPLDVSDIFQQLIALVYSTTLQKKLQKILVPPDSGLDILE